MIGPRTAAIGRRLLIGETFDGELDDVPESFRTQFQHLKRLPGPRESDARGRAWDGFLAGRPDRVEIIQAMARAPAEGDLPEADEAADEWPPLRLGGLPPVEPFPVQVLPGPAADFACALAASIGCPVDFVALPCLIAAGAAIGRSATLLLKPDYFASASLYGMNAGGPSSGKSPALEAAVRPLWDIDEALHDEYRRRKAEFDEAEEAYAKAPKDARPPRPARPVIESAVLDDTTVEAVARHLAINPRGLLVARDEGSAWVASLNQYKNGKGPTVNSGSRPCSASRSGWTVGGIQTWSRSASGILSWPSRATSPRTCSASCAIRGGGPTDSSSACCSPSPTRGPGPTVPKRASRRRVPPHGPRSSPG